MIRRIAVWVRGQIGLLSWKILVWPLFLLSELLDFGYWIVLQDGCTGTAADVKLMLLCNGGDPVFVIDAVLIAPFMAVVWHAVAGDYRANRRRDAIVGVAMLFYFFVVRFFIVWLLAHWQVKTWADLV